ncbi:unnamed protein product [Rhizophagus irregularis]|nr:unnamed protein product [Rhizophagus irregularis]
MYRNIIRTLGLWLTGSKSALHPRSTGNWDSNAGICYCILDVLSINGEISIFRYFNWRLTSEEMKEDLFQCITEKADFIWIKTCSCACIIFDY